MSNGQNHPSGAHDRGPGDSRAPEDWARLGPAVPRTEETGLLTGSASGTASASDTAPPGNAGAAGATPWAEPGTRPVPATTADPGSSVPGGSPRGRPDAPGAPTTAAPKGAFRLLTRLLMGLAVPLGLLAVSVRLVATPVFLWIEYHRPGFPEDPFGFGSGARMTLGSHGMDYILNWAPAAFLGNVRAPDGSPWFGPEEISHMTDVKYVMQIGLGLGFAVALLAVVIWFARRRIDAQGLIRAAMRGAWLTLALIVVLGVVAALAWQWFFATFHSLFFASGTWTFSLSDTLIRLYPTQFWIDAAATVGVLTILGALLVLICGRRALRRRRGR